MGILFFPWAYGSLDTSGLSGLAARGASALFRAKPAPACLWLWTPSTPQGFADARTSDNNVPRTPAQPPEKIGIVRPFRLDCRSVVVHVILRLGAEETGMSEALMADSTISNVPISPNARRLLFAGFFAILTAGVGFSIRSGILSDWAAQYGFSATQNGEINGAGFTGFCFGIIIGGLIADKIGYGPLVLAAFALHAVSAV